MVKPIENTITNLQITNLLLKIKSSAQNENQFVEPSKTRKKVKEKKGAGNVAKRNTKEQNLGTVCKCYVLYVN
ncbi:hypothetical protein BLOT_015148 [Blomia tropicalis]|nr:hypothetical protein BLOT_015148 [Blomia tropicalis]